MPALPALRWSHVAATTLFAGSMGLLLLGTLSIVVWNEPPWRLMGMIAATLEGPDALASGETIVPHVLATAFCVHFFLTALYATAFASVALEMRPALVPWAGLAFGALLYVAHFHGFTLRFAWFEQLRSPDTFAAHLLFGLWLSAAAGREALAAGAAARLANS